MNCAELQGLTKVPPEALNAYIACMEAPAAGPPQMHTVTAAQGIFFWAVIIALAGSQLPGASNSIWVRALWGVVLAGIVGLLYSAFNL